MSGSSFLILQRNKIQNFLLIQLAKHQIVKLFLKGLNIKRIGFKISL
jgi:hypothetical protein